MQLPSSHSPHVGPTRIRAPLGQTRPRWQVRRTLVEAQCGSSFVPGASAEKRISPTPSCAMATAVGSSRSSSATVLGQRRATSEPGPRGTVAPKSTNSRHSPPGATISASCDAFWLPTAVHAFGMPEAAAPPPRSCRASSRISSQCDSSSSTHGNCWRSHQALAVRPGVQDGGCCHSSCHRAPAWMARRATARPASKLPQAS
mmetsp:Transcript_42572/g.135240  ORF Transcript_42572/g.135240 Transcript_42572/m.135240 type:complete len:202 (-) Transcript_42572:346-951(-)